MFIMEPSSPTIPDTPNRMWGTDATRVRTRKEGVATVFVAVDHFVGDVVGIHAARPGARFEALEPIRQDLREHYGPLVKDVAADLVLRHDHSPQHMSHATQQEIALLGIESNPSFVHSPQGNGVAERFVRTLKEQLLWVRTFDTVVELRLALLEFKERSIQPALAAAAAWLAVTSQHVVHWNPVP